MPYNRYAAPYTLKGEDSVTHATGVSSLKAWFHAALPLLLAQGLGLVTLKVLSHSMGPDAYGRLGLALALGVYAFQWTQWGMDGLLTPRLVRASAADAQADLAALLRQKQFSAALALMVGGAVSFAWPVPGERLLIYIGLADGALMAFTAPSAFEAGKALPTYNLFGALRQVLYLLGVIALVALQHTPAPLSVMAVHAGALLLQVILEWRWVTRRYGPLPVHRATPRAAELWRAAVPLALAAAGLQVLNFLGPPLTEVLGRGDVLAWVVLSNQLAIVLASFLNILGRQFLVLAAAYSGTDFGKWIARQAVLYAGGGILVAAAVSLPAPLIVPWIFGEQYRAVGFVFAIDAWRAVGLLAGSVTGAALLCQHRTIAFAVCHGLALLAGIIAGVVLIPRHGADGAAWAAVAGRAAFPIFSGVALLAASRRARNGSKP